jgi:cyclic pyranopterin phosphate synthase
VLDRFNRKLDYLRISVTDRCNLRCRYCMPEEGIKPLRHEDILSFYEIADFTRIAVDHGVTKVRITGGEPLVRKGIVTLVSMLAGISGIKDLSMTTNGVLLAESKHKS